MTWLAEDGIEMPRSPEECSEYGYRTVLHHKVYTNGEATIDEDDIVDCITNILHCAKDYGDVDTMLRRAQGHYNQEKNATEI